MAGTTSMFGCPCLYPCFYSLRLFQTLLISFKVSANLLHLPLPKCLRTSPFLLVLQFQHLFLLSLTSSPSTLPKSAVLFLLPPKQVFSCYHLPLRSSVSKCFKFDRMLLANSFAPAPPFGEGSALLHHLVMGQH